MEQEIWIKKILECLGYVSQKIITSTGEAVENAISGFGQFFHGSLGDIGRTIKWVLITIFLALVFFIFHVCKLKNLIPASNLDAPSDSTESITDLVHKMNPLPPL